MERLHSEARPKEGTQKMRAASGRASGRLDIQRFVEELQEDPTLVEEREVRLARSAYSRQWQSHFVRVSDLSTPELVTPLWPSSLSLVGRRARSLGLPDD